jgi:hypothetical protein
MMTTTLNPPPPTAPQPTGPEGHRPASGASRVIAIVLIVFGALVILGAIVSAVISTVAAASVHTTTRSVAATGVSDLDVDVAAGALRVEFADVQEAELEVTSSWGAERWTFDRQDDRLVVASPDRFGPWFFDGWFANGPGDAVLRLPSSLEGADADISLAAGDLEVQGDFGDLALDLGAGRADIGGSADTLTADVSAGRADLDLDDVSTASLSVSAGALNAVLTGSQPDEIVVDVSAGSMELTVPEGEYDVTSDVSAGGFDNTLGSSPGASSTIDVQVAAGQVMLRAR